MLYFAFGSNLDLDQMLARCPSAVMGPCAVLFDHALVFAGHSSRWGGGVATVVRAERRRVQGLIYSVSSEDMASLDRIEGVPYAYSRVERIVVDEHCRRRRVHLYIQPEDGMERRLPGLEYFDVILRAYREHGLDRRQLAAAIQIEETP